MQQAEGAGPLAQLPEVADVVDMRVGVHKELGAPAVALEQRGDLVHAVAAVHDDRLAGLLVGHDRAVAGERSRPETFRMITLIDVDAEVVKPAVEVSER